MKMYKQWNLTCCSSAGRKIASFCFSLNVEKKKRKVYESNLSSNLSFTWAAIAGGHVTSLGQAINPNWIVIRDCDDSKRWLAQRRWSSLTIRRSEATKESRPLNNEYRHQSASTLFHSCARFVRWVRTLFSTFDQWIYSARKKLNAIYRKLSLSRWGKIRKK